MSNKRRNGNKVRRGEENDLSPSRVDELTALKIHH